MYVAVHRIYKAGLKVTRQPPVVGQLACGDEGHRRVLRVWPVAWVPNVSAWHEPPLADLWQPVFAGVYENYIVFTGLEAHGSAPRRRWTAQKWSCELLTPAGARDYFAGPAHGPLPPTPGIPPSPVDEDAPFG